MSHWLLTMAPELRANRAISTSLISEGFLDVINHQRLTLPPELDIVAAQAVCLTLGRGRCEPIPSEKACRALIFAWRVVAPDPCRGVGS